MPTPVYVCGAECGLVVLGGTALVSPHWDAKLGTAIASETTLIAPSGGARSYKFNPTGGQASLKKNWPSTPGIGVGRFKFMQSVRPAVEAVICIVGGPANPLFIRLGTTGTLRTALGASTQNGPTIALNTWCIVDFRITYNATTYVLDWYVDGVLQTQMTLAGQTAGTASNFEIGVTFTSVTTTLYIDDIMLSNTGGDFPIGNGKTLGFVPVSDGTHTATGSNFLKNAAGAAITSATTDAYQLIDELPLGGGSDWINQAVVASGEYVETVFGTTSETSPPRGVEAVVARHETNTNTVSAVFKLYDALGTTEDDVLNYNVQAGNASLRYTTKQYAVRPAALGAWTLAAFNALRFRFGYSNDATPDVYFDGVVLEAEFAIAVSASAGLASGTGAAANASVSLSPTTPVATGTGSAGNSSISLAASAPTATGTGTAYNPTVTVPASTSANAGLASGTGAAYGASINLGPTVANPAIGLGVANNSPPAIAASINVATGVGAANTATPKVQPNAAVAIGTGAAASPSPSVFASAGLAAGTGIAFNPSSTSSASVGVAVGTGAANQPSVASSTNTGAATGTGSAGDAGPSVQPSANVAAGTALGSGAAGQLSSAVEAHAGLATGSGEAFDAAVTSAPSVTAPAGMAVGLGAALGPSASVQARAGLAAGTGTAFGAVPLISMSGDAHPPAATGTGVALGPSPKVSANAGLASGVGLAHNPSSAIEVHPGTASGVGIAGDVSELLPPNLVAIVSVDAKQLAALTVERHWVAAVSVVTKPVTAPTSDDLIVELSVDDKPLAEVIA